MLSYIYIALSGIASKGSETFVNRLDNTLSQPRPQLGTEFTSEVHNYQNVVTSHFAGEVLNVLSLCNALTRHAMLHTRSRNHHSVVFTSRTLSSIREGNALVVLRPPPLGHVVRVVTSCPIGLDWSDFKQLRFKRYTFCI